MKNKNDNFFKILYIVVSINAMPIFFILGSKSAEKRIMDACEVESKVVIQNKGYLCATEREVIKERQKRLRRLSI